MDRDQNAAINILKKASGGPERTSAEMAKAPLMNQEASDFSPR
jgi:transposase